MDIIPAISTPLPREFYLAYLNSAEWRSRRNRALKHAGYRCERCQSKRDLQVHHKTYERLGKEFDSDLEVLCATCHEGEHIEQTHQSELRIYLRLATEALKADPFSSIGALSEAVKTLCATHRIQYDGSQIHRALELITGTRLKRGQNHRPARDERPPDPVAINPSEAHELLCRLGAFGFVKAMPAVERTPAEQQAHEATIRGQISAFHMGVPRRESIHTRLVAIFEKVPARESVA